MFFTTEQLNANDYSRWVGIISTLTPNSNIIFIRQIISNLGIQINTKEYNNDDDDTEKLKWSALLFEAGFKIAYCAQQREFHSQHPPGMSSDQLLAAFKKIRSHNGFKKLEERCDPFCGRIKRYIEKLSAVSAGSENIANSQFTP